MTSKFIPNCLITGCWLREGEVVAYGDLHELDGCYIFNAIVNRSGETNWQIDTELLPTSRILDVSNSFTFERRGIIIAAKHTSVLSPAAQEYIHHG
jgi:hypothetical protein